jgi:hypothetical protein
MIDAGTVGAVFSVEDRVSSVLKAIATQFENLDRVIKQTKESLASFKLPPAVTAQLESLNKQLAALPETSRGAVGGVETAFGAIDASIAGTMGRVTTLKAEMLGLGKIPGLPAAAGGGGWAGSRRGTGGEGGHGGGGTIGVHEHVGPLGFRSHDGLMIGGAVAGFSVWEALKASADLQQVQENLKAGGVSTDVIERATRQSFDLGQKYGLPARDILQGANEIRNPLNPGTTANAGLEAAMRHMDTLAGAAVVLKAQGGKNGGDTARELYNMVKSAEFRNAIGDKQFDSAINAMVRADVATGGIVTPNAFLQMSQMMKSSLPGVSDDFLYKIMPEMAQEFRGAPAGTAMASLYQQLIAGQMKTKGLNLLADLGLVNDDKVEFNSIGMIKAANPGFYKDADTFRKDPLKGIADLIEAMKSHGITSESAQRDELSNLFGNRNAAQMAQTLAFQYARLGRGAQGISNTNDVNDTAADLLKNNPYTQWAEFTSAATNAGAALGSNLMPEATAALKNLAATVNGFGALFSGRGGAADINKAIFGTADAPGWMKWIEGNWSADKRLFGGGSGPHPVVGPRAMLDNLNKASQIPVPDFSKIDPGYAERKRINDALNPPVAATALSQAGYMPGDLQSEIGREASRANALSAMKSIGDQIQGVLERIPGQVQPSISNLASIGSAIADAINNIAANARSAASAIPKGTANQSVTVRTSIAVSGRQLAEVVSGHQLSAVRTASNGGMFDSASLPAPTDASYSFA